MKFKSDEINSKVFRVLQAAILSEIIIMLVTLIGITCDVKVYGIILSIFLLIIGVPFHRFGMKHRKLYWISALFNTLSIGLVIAGYYTIRNISVDFLLSISVLLFVIVGIFIIYYSKVNLKIVKRAIICGLVLLIILTIFNGKMIGYSMLFFLLLNLVFYISLASKISEEEVYRQISIHSYGIYGITLLVILSLLAEEPLLDDGGFFSGPDKKKRY